MLQTGHLRSLQQVLATGSFAEAGARLGFTPSAVSQQIGALERSIGLALFERGPHSIRPTAAALALRSRVQVVLEQLSALEHDILAIASGKQGTVRVSSFPTASASLVPAGLAHLRRTHPDLDVLLDTAAPTELGSKLKVGLADLVVNYEHDLVPQRWPGDVTRIPLLHESFVLLVSREHAVADRKAVTITELADDTWITGLENAAGTRSLERMCAAAHFAPRVGYRSDDYNVIQGLVGVNLGIAIVPALAYIPDPLIHPMSIEGEDFGRRVFVLHRVDDPNPALNAVIHALRRAAQTCARANRWITIEGSS